VSRYQLRSSLELVRDGAQWLLHDAELARAVRLGDTDALLARALVGGATLTQLLKTTKLSEGELLQHLRGLARLYLLQGRRSAQRVVLQAEKRVFVKLCEADAGSEPLQWPMGRNPPQHQCVGTGTCCSASFLGPLTSGDVRRVSALSFGRSKRFAAGDEALFEQTQFGGRGHTGMARNDAGQCQAQGPDMLCEIHYEHGLDAKPIACRQFPLRFYRSPRGVHVSLLLACDGYDRARNSSILWDNREQEVRKLLTEGATAVRMALPCELSAGLPVPAAFWWGLRDELFALEPTGALEPQTWLRAVIGHVQKAITQRHLDLTENAELGAPADLAALTAGLAAPAELYAQAEVAPACAQLRARARTLQAQGFPSESQRLFDFALALEAQLAGKALQPRGAFVATEQAQLHLNDIVANDLQLQVALGQLDAGLANLTRRLLLAEALACALAQADGRDTVQAIDTTRALHVVYRSEPDLTALAVLQRPRR